VHGDETLHQNFETDCANWYCPSVHTKLSIHLEYGLMLKQVTTTPLGTELLVSADSFLTDLSVEDEAMITGGDRSRSRSNSRPRRRRRRRRNSRT
jgi:hypothetical protein